MKSLMALLDYQRGDYVTTPNERHIWKVHEKYGTKVRLVLYKMKDQYTGRWERHENLAPITCENDGLVLYMDKLP